MKKSFFCFFLFLISCNSIIAQEIVDSNITGGTFIYKKKLNFVPDQAITFGSHSFLVQKSTEKYKGILVCVNNSGNEIFRQNFDRSIWDFSATHDGEFVAVSVTKFFAVLKNSTQPEYYTHIYNKLGKLISKTRTSSCFTKISKYGDFLITTRVEPSEDAGHFEIFNAVSGTNIPLPFNKRSSHFFADFIDNSNIVLVTEHVSLTRNNLPPRTPGSLLKSYEITDSLMIYNIETNSIVLNEKINYAKTKYFSTNNSKKSIWVSPDEDKFCIIGSINTPNEKFSSQRQALMMFDKNGNTIWKKSFENENNQYEGLDDMIFIDNDNILLLKFGLKNSELKMINSQNGKEKWNKKLEANFTAKIRGYVLPENSSIITIDFESYKKQYDLTMKLNFNTGALISQSDSINILTQRKFGAIISNKSDEINFMEYSETQ